MKLIFKTLSIVTICLTALLAGCANSGSTSVSESVSTAKSISEGNTVYFAAPLFNQAEKDYNLKITHVLENHGYDVFLPQRDGIEGATLKGKTEQELIDIIFPLDVEHVRGTDILFMNLDGRVPDEGACVELGMAYAMGKRCYGFKTDTHAAESGMDLNPMISGCMAKIFKNIDGDKLIDEIENYLDNNQL